MAKKFQDEKGTDWNAYILEKEKAGFCIFSEWQFMDYNHILTQLKSKFKTKWGTRMTGIQINDRKVEVQLFIAGFQKVKNNCHHELCEALHGPRNDDGSRPMEDHLNGSKDGKKIIQDMLEPFQAVGHGINFCAAFEVDKKERPKLARLCEGVAMYDLKAFSVIWTNHDFMVLILHESNAFVEADEE